MFLHMLKAEKILNKMFSLKINQEKQNIIIMHAQVYSCILEANCIGLKNPAQSPTLFFRPLSD